MEHPDHVLDARPRWRLGELSVPERPAVAVCEVGPRRVETLFRLEAIGVSRSDPRPASMACDPVPIGQILAGLTRGQRLTITYSARPDPQSAASGVAVTVDGRAVGRTAREACERSSRLWRDLLVNLAAFAADCRFAPVTPVLSERTPSSSACRVQVRPAGVSIPAPGRAAIGFCPVALERRTAAVLIAPRFNLADDLDALVRVLASQLYPISISVGYSPIVVGPRALAIVRRALKTVRSGVPRDLGWQGDGGGHQVDAAEWPARLGQGLDCWVANPRGYQVSCGITSEHHVPSALVALASRAVFGQAAELPSVDLKQIANGATPTSRAPSIDLARCVNIAAAVPPLIPSARALLDSGLAAIPAPGTPLATHGLIVGRTRGSVVSYDVRFGGADRTRHMYVCGATGSGKSTLLYNMAVQDIETGAGVCVIDPHGDLYHQLLAAVPRDRAGEVVLIDPSDTEFAVGINLLECPGPHRAVQMNFVTNELIRIFDRLYDLRATGGPMFEQYMRNAALLVLDNSRADGTLLDIPALFEDDSFRRELKRTCQNPLVERFWSRQAERAGGEASLANMAPYVTSKLNQFTMNAIMRPIIGQARSTIDFRRAMDEGAIVLVNLSRGVLGELDAQLLGMVIVGQIFTAALSRAGSSRTRRPFFVYIDEFQHFTTDTVAYVLSESRKYGLALTLANQTLSQLLVNRGRQNVLDAVLGNCGTMLTFRLGSIDAERLEPYTKPEFTARDLQDLPDFHAAARLLVGNRPTRPFVLATLPPLASDCPADATEILAASRARCARPVAEVEQEILQRRASVEGE